MAARQRRRIKVQQGTNDKADIAIERLNKIAEEDVTRITTIKRLQDEMLELGVEAQALMKFLKTTELRVPGCGTHTFKESVSNKSRTVRPKDFKKAVGDNAFWMSATVPIKNAQKHLGEKELAAVVDETPGEIKPAVYKFLP